MNNQSTSTILYEANDVMNRIAERLLQDKVGISYTRFIFLFVVKEHAASTQHRIAAALRVSDPAVSKISAEVVHDGLIRITTNPQHKRQRLIELTPAGLHILNESMAALDSCFSDVCARAGIDEVKFRTQSLALLDNLNQKYEEVVI